MSQSQAAETKLWSKEAEEGVLGSALINSETYWEMTFLRPSDFYLERNAEVWRAIRSIMDSDELGLDTLTVEEVLKRRERLGMIGGPARLAELVGAVPTSLHAGQYAEIVRDYSARRSLVETWRSGVREVINGEPVDQIISSVSGQMVQSGVVSRGASREWLDEAIEHHLDAQSNPQDVWGIRTGWPDIDRELGGVHPGESFVIAGEPSTGKSMFAAQTAAQMAGLEFWSGQKVEATPVAFYELEMRGVALAHRLACALTRVDWWKVKAGRLSNEESYAFTEAIERIRSAPLFVSDDTHWATASLRSDVYRLMKEEGVRAVFIDYDDLLKDRADGSVERQILISKGLHDLAKMGVAVIAVSTLNKGGFRGPKNLGAVRGSVQKTYDADVVGFLEQDDSQRSVRNFRLHKAREADKQTGFDLIMRGSQKRLEVAHRSGAPEENGSGPVDEQQEIPF